MASQINPKNLPVEAPVSNGLSNRDTVLSLFDVPDRESVLSYLDAHEKLLPVLAEARQEIANYFLESRLELSVFPDPDDLTLTELFIYIHTTLSVDEAMKRLNSFDKNWYIEADRRAGQTFNVNLRFP